MSHDTPTEALARAMRDVIQAQGLIETFYLRARSLIHEAEVALLAARPRLDLVRTPAYEIYSPTPLGLDHPEAWLRRWLAVFFAEPRFLRPEGLPEGEPVALTYLLFNLDPHTVPEAELDLVILHDVTGLTGRLQAWLSTFWNLGTFDLTVPPDGWYGREEPIDLGQGATMRLQLHRVPLSRVPDREALHREVIQRLVDRYASVVHS